MLFIATSLIRGHLRARSKVAQERSRHDEIDNSHNSQEDPAESQVSQWMSVIYRTM